MEPQKGNIAMYALLTSLAIVLLSSLISTTTSLLSHPNNIKTQALGTECSFHTEVQVIKEDHSILQISQNGGDNWGISSPFSPFGRFDDNGNEINQYFDDLSMYVYHNDNEIIPTNPNDSTRDVNLIGLDINKWKIIGQFCTQLKNGSLGCPTNFDPTSTSTTISGLQKSCGVTIKYGWIVSPKNNDDSGACKLDTPSCTPVSPTIEFSSENRVRVSWSNPIDCGGLQYNLDTIQANITDEAGDIICSKTVDVDRTDTATDCKLGRDVIRNTQSPENLTSSETYTASIRIANENGSCMSPSKEIQSTYNTNPTGPPPSPPPHQVCEEKDQACEDFYVEACTTGTNKPGKKSCHKVGVCSSPGDGTKCSWIPEKSSCGACIPNERDNDDNPTGACRTIIGSGPTRVLFIPDNFSSGPQFAQFTSQAIGNVRATNLGSLYNEFTFVAYNRFNKNYGCREGVPYLGGTQFGCTNDSTIRASMSECGAQAGLVISNIGGLGATSLIGSGIASLKIGTISFSAHELGHAIANLFDEYRFPNGASSGGSQSVYPNCSSSSQCNWTNGSSGLGCFSVCGFTNWYKSTQTSVMQNDRGLKTNIWNKPSLDGWQLALSHGQNSFKEDDATGQASLQASFETAGARYNQSLYLNVRQNQRGELVLEDIQIKNTYPIELDHGLTSNYFTVNMIDSQQNVLFTEQFKSKVTSVSEPNPPEEILREQIDLYLPYFDNLASIEIFDSSNQKKLDVDLDEFDLPVPTPAQSLCGNGVCDSQLGENQNSCQEDCRPQNDYRDDYKKQASDINRDGTVNILDCSVCLQQYKKTSSSLSCDIINDSMINVLDYTACIDNLGTKVTHTPENTFNNPTPTTGQGGNPTL